jgi:hypothetical protein
MAKVSLNSHPEYVSQALKRYRVAPAMAKPRPGAGKGLLVVLWPLVVSYR